MNNDVNFFSPIYFSENDEQIKNKYLGKFANLYFDFGQQSYRVADHQVNEVAQLNLNQNEVPVLNESSKSSKWLSNAVRVGLGLTLVVPIAAIVSNKIYKNSNQFVNVKEKISEVKRNNIQLELKRLYPELYNEFQQAISEGSLVTDEDAIMEQMNKAGKDESAKKYYTAISLGMLTSKDGEAWNLVYRVVRMQTPALIMMRISEKEGHGFPDVFDPSPEGIVYLRGDHANSIIELYRSKLPNAWENFTQKMVKNGMAVLLEPLSELKNHMKPYHKPYFPQE